MLFNMSYFVLFSTFLYHTQQKICFTIQSQKYDFFFVKD